MCVHTVASPSDVFAAVVVTGYEAGCTQQEMNAAFLASSLSPDVELALGSQPQMTPMESDDVLLVVESLSLPSEVEAMTVADV